MGRRMGRRGKEPAESDLIVLGVPRVGAPRTIGSDVSDLVVLGVPTMGTRRTIRSDLSDLIVLGVLTEGTRRTIRSDSADACRGKPLDPVGD